MTQPTYDRQLHPSLEAWGPTEADAWDRAKAAHLLDRAGFGGTPQELDAVVAAGPRRAMDVLLDFPDASAREMDASDRPDDSMLDGVPRTDVERRDALNRVRQETGGDPDRLRTAVQLQRQSFDAASRRHMNACASWWLNRMADGPYPLQERLTLMWSGHFTSSFRDDRSGSWRLWNQNETLRRHAAGNFLDLVRRISRDAAMLSYLNNDRNVARSPNENYARELLELFTLGEGNYAESDVKEVARAFTGWAHDGESFRFRGEQHDAGNKTIFGTRGRFGGDEVAMLIARHPACGPYVAGRVYHYFVGAAPAPDVAASLGRVLVNANYELRPLLRVIMGSRAFYMSEHVGIKIKEPLHFVVGTHRLLGVALPPANRLNNILEKLGQVPFVPPNVKGWPGQYDGRRWINTATLLARYNYASEVARGADPTGDVRAWAERLIPRGVPDAKLRQAGRAQPPAEALALVVSMPEYQLS